MTAELPRPARRTVARVETKRRLGPDAQVDDKAMIIGPDAPRLTDPFLVLSEDWFSSPGFEWHPHRGVETVTTVLDGVLEHGDNAGHAGALEPGDVQWMTAGRGIIHRELAYRNEHAHTLQLWVNMPASAKLADTRYQDIRAAARPVSTAGGVRIDVISGPPAAGRGVPGPAVSHWPVSGALLTLEPAAALDYALLAAGQIAWSGPAGPPGESSVLAVSAAPDQDQVTTIMLYSGQPIGEPVVLGGPFVMNTQAEIAAAFADFQRGAFGPVPRMMRL